MAKKTPPSGDSYAAGMPEAQDGAPEETVSAPGVSPQSMEEEGAGETLAEGGIEEPGPELPNDGPLTTAGRLMAGPPPDPAEVAMLEAETKRIQLLLKDDPAYIPPTSILLKEDTDISSAFETRLSQAAQYRWAFEGRWLSAWMDYNQKLDVPTDKWNSKIFLPIMYEQVSTALPAAVAAALDSGKMLDYEPRDTATDARKAKVMASLVDYHMTLRTDIRPVISDWLWYAYLFGTGYLKTGWKRADRWKRISIPVYDGEGPTKQFIGTRLELKNIPVHDEPDVYAVDLWNCFPCPWATRPNDHLPYFIERIETTAEELLTACEEGAYGPGALERVKEWLAGKPTMDLGADTIYSRIGGRSMALQQVGLGSPYLLSRSENDAGDEGNSAVICYEWWTQDFRILIAGDGSRKVLGKQAFPYTLDDLPYVGYWFDRIPKSPFGRGIGDIAGPIQKQANFDVNHANDSRRLRLNAPMVARRTGNSLVEGDLEMKPGKIIKVREMDDVQPLVIPDTTGSVLEWQAMLLAHADKATGATDQMKGVPQSGVGTATEASILAQAGSMRGEQRTADLRASLKKLGCHLMRLEQQFVTTETAIKVAGPAGFEWRKVSPEDLMGDFDVIPSASLSRSNMDILRRDWSVIYPILVSNPLTKQRAALVELLRIYGIRDPERFVNDPAPPPVNPVEEEIALGQGIVLPVSPMDDHLAHMQIHQQARAVKAMDPNTNPSVIGAYDEHLALHAAAWQEAMAQMSAGASAMTGGGKKEGAPGSGPVRDGATRLGQAQGSDGPPGKSPGPSNPPGRPTEGART